jgi:hypothetical protein
MYIPFAYQGASSFFPVSGSIARMEIQTALTTNLANTQAISSVRGGPDYTGSAFLPLPATGGNYELTTDTSLNNFPNNAVSASAIMISNYTGSVGTVAFIYRINKIDEFNSTATNRGGNTLIDLDTTSATAEISYRITDNTSFIGAKYQTGNYWVSNVNNPLQKFTIDYSTITSTTNWYGWPYNKNTVLMQNYDFIILNPKTLVSITDPFDFFTILCNKSFFDYVGFGETYGRRVNICAAAAWDRNLSDAEVQQLYTYYTQYLRYNI